MTDTTPLKPCPFCGLQPERFDLVAWCWGPKGMEHGAVRMLIAHWNDRTEQSRRDKLWIEYVELAADDAMHAPDDERSVHLREIRAALGYDPTRPLSEQTPKETT